MLDQWNIIKWRLWAKKVHAFMHKFKGALELMVAWVHLWQSSVLHFVVAPSKVNILSSSLNLDLCMCSISQFDTLFRTKYLHSGLCSFFLTNPILNGNKGKMDILKNNRFWNLSLQSSAKVMILNIGFVKVWGLAKCWLTH